MFKQAVSVTNAGITNEVLILGLWNEGLSKEEHSHYKCFLKRIHVTTRNLPNNIIFSSIKYFEWCIKVIIVLWINKIQFIHVHSLKSLPVAVLAKLFLDSKLVYDAHELETEANGLKGKLKVICRVFEKFLIKFTDEVLTVSDLIAEHYRTQYPGISPIVIRNIPQLELQSSSKSNLRTILDIPKNDILLLYLGGLVTGRGIERALSCLSKKLDKFHVAFIGSGTLEKKIKSISILENQIHHYGPVAPDEVVSYAKAADIGLCLIEDLCLSYRLSLPNKLFEYLLAGIPVIINDLPEQRKFVEKYNCGWVLSDSENDLYNFLKELSLKDILDKKSGAEKVRTDLNWEREVEPYIKICKRYNFIY